MNTEAAAGPITGAEIVVRCLAVEGVEHVFGYPGGAVLYIYDAIFQQNKFQHILVRHEQAAIHAADAYSRSSNKVGVAIVTSGPGVTNAVTGLSTAYMDSIPMVIITGHQAPGTRGARIANGEKSIRIYGQEVEVHAEVVQLTGASAHADANQTLAWLRRMKQAPDQVCVVHGEMQAADMLRQRIEHQLHWPACVPEHGSTLNA